jgi:hypothetical protein
MVYVFQDCHIKIALIRGLCQFEYFYIDIVKTIKLRSDHDAKSFRDKAGTDKIFFNLTENIRISIDAFE